MERMETTARTCTFFGSRQRRMQGNLCHGWWFVPSADPFGQGSKSVRAFMVTITSPSASRSPLSLSATFRRFLLSLSLSFSLPPPRNPYENSPPCEVCSAARTTFLRSPAISRATVLFFFSLWKNELSLDSDQDARESVNFSRSTKGWNVIGTSIIEISSGKV